VNRQTANEHPEKQIELLDAIFGTAVPIVLAICASFDTWDPESGYNMRVSNA